MKKIKILLTSLLIIFSINKNSYAFGVNAGVQLNLVDNIFTDKIKLVIEDHIFIGADVFANYYSNTENLKYNYGYKGTLGYKISGFSIYGLGGIQYAGLRSDISKQYKEDKAPIYGVGIGYDVPILPIGIRLNNTYFNLERNDGTKNRFNNIDLGLIVVF